MFKPTDIFSIMKSSSSSERGSHFGIDYDEYEKSSSSSVSKYFQHTPRGHRHNDCDDDNDC